MKLMIRISALSLIILAAVASNSSAKTAGISSITPSSVPGASGSMPSCNPFKNANCPGVR
jgi:hypothetical protein